MIRDAMRAVDTYNEIYEPTIKALAKTERQLSRAEKEWRKQGGQMVARMTNKAGAEYMAKDPYWSAVEKLRADGGDCGVRRLGAQKTLDEHVRAGGLQLLVDIVPIDARLALYKRHDVLGVAHRDAAFRILPHDVGDQLARLARRVDREFDVFHISIIIVPRPLVKKENV